MRILHLNSYYIDNKLYSVLYSYLTNYVEQYVYCPLKTNRKEVKFNDAAEICFSRIIKPIHRFFYFRKVKHLIKDIIGKIDLANVDVIHAHNLFIDGAIANYIYKKEGIPYICALRSTDIDLQYTYMIHRRGFANNILDNAKKIIFISKAFQIKFQKIISGERWNSYAKKAEVIYNGIDPFWIKNQQMTKKHINKDVKLLYVGQLIKRKNLLNMILAVDLLNQNTDGLIYSLTVIGGIHPDENDFGSKILREMGKREYIEYKGKISDKELLANEYRANHIFLMPSYRELFGIVYIEALSQNMPILYSKNEGIDGIFKEGVIGYPVDPKEIKSITKGIENIVINYNSIVNNNKELGLFDWEKIVKQYTNIYNSVYE